MGVFFKRKSSISVCDCFGFEFCRLSVVSQLKKRGSQKLFAVQDCRKAYIHVCHHFYFKQTKCDPELSKLLLKSMNPFIFVVL